ncbi:CRISPR-associated helicase/endonuclease Cas3 [Thermobifida cellulosilytica]|uniref:CRISPR-associated protein Cas3 n=1 Tax=Thermobifida cellulosilytica TB100 TaxID=665004 RepID=A0A147KJK6_THECS|nr:CRISPR-associated helicase/endonuclease Cas3 [Thermobifida cellulosilytica]KUP97431.1 CRISPR-associated protein Cas3 [Thermobifida cellulosilytica TB100]
MGSDDSPQPWPGGLSAAARSVWAKHDRELGWLPLWQHMADSAAVAGRLWDEWLPRQVRRLVAEALPGGEEDARRLAVWLAAVHDVGKATPAFACQVEELAAAMRDAGLGMPRREQLPDRRMVPHGLAGQVLLQKWLVERHGWTRRETLQFAIVVGGHHGVPPTNSDISQVNIYRNLLCTPACEDVWRRVQDELLDTAAAACGAAQRLGEWQRTKLPQPVQAVLSALVIVADWIASNVDLFPYFSAGQAAPEPGRADTAWKRLALPRPWQAVESEEEPEALFAARFALPPGATIRPVQAEAVRLAREMAAPGLMIIEAPMGEGKTEAALAAAEIFAARSGAGGCFIALPTMATGNAMFPRMLNWLRRLPDARADPGAHTVFLAHSKAALNKEYAGLVSGGTDRIADVDRDGADDEWRPGDDERASSAELVAHHWLRGRKKGMLSSFVAGTIDQLLFAGLKSRHLALRHLAVAGKVVVVDEAHAYDAYMNSYLDRVLSWLGAYGVPVVVLSATLPARRRRELAAAYTGSAVAEADLAEVEKADGYPLLTGVTPGATPQLRFPAASGRATEVCLERLDDDLDVLADRLAEELADGGCALVVRNTVDRVHQTARHLSERFGADRVSVAHARFVDLDRVENDARLLAAFGPPDKVREAGGKRPDTHIVVASQVVEQSLDVDFDLLASDLAPVDLLLQRMGRLHRHRRGEGQSERPPRLRTARCLVTGVDWTAKVPRPVRGSRLIYRDYPLLRALAVLEPLLAQAGTGEGAGAAVRLPADINPLVQAAYGPDPVGPPSWQEALEQARDDHELHRVRQRIEAEQFMLAKVGRPGRPLTGWADGGVGDADDTRRGAAQVRDGRPTLEVLVVRRRADGVLTTLPGLSGDRGGLEVPGDEAPSAPLARIVAGSALRLPYQFGDPDVLAKAVAELAANSIPAWQTRKAYWLAGELVLILDENCRSRLAGYELRYTRTDGLEVHRDN